MKFAHLASLAIFVLCSMTFSMLILFNLRITDAGQTRLLYVISQCKTCETGSKLAESDFDDGSYLLIRWGLPETISEITGEVLESDFRIRQMYGGCVGREEVGCYTNRMYSLLQEKFGTEFYVLARDKAYQLYTERKNSNPKNADRTCQ
jgi:hypothetical protein